MIKNIKITFAILLGVIGFPLYIISSVVQNFSTIILKKWENILKQIYPNWIESVKR